MTLFHGSCLCGSVAYELEGEAVAFYHCHCQRCRKFSGTGHASNMRIQTQSIHWLKGEALVKSFKVPEADRFRNDFCADCGSPLPRYFPQIGLVVLPAGTLDMEPPAVEKSRIFYASRAAWSCEDGLPRFDEYPPQ